VWKQELELLGKAIALSYGVQLSEGMTPIEDVPGCVGRKYCGGGFGGYALYLFRDPVSREAALTRPGFRPIEPYVGLK
jgi:hypothetical protein